MKRQNYIFYNISLTLLFLFTTVSCEKSFKEALDRVADSRETLAGMLNDATKVRGMFEACYEGIPANRMYLYFWTSEEELSDNCFDAMTQGMGNWR